MESLTEHSLAIPGTKWKLLVGHDRSFLDEGSSLNDAMAVLKRLFNDYVAIVIRKTSFMDNPTSST